MSLSLSGLGHVSNVGLTAEGTAAAQRAGIFRASAIDGLWTYDPDDLEAPVRGAAVPYVTEGFFQSTRWVRLGERALADLVRYRRIEDASGFWERARLLWVVPDVDFDRFRVPEDQVDEFLDLCCKRVLLAVTGLEIRPEQVTLVPGGAARVASACRHAEQELAAGASRVVVLATDSWLDTLSVTTLAEEGRLKDAEHPMGLCPGEAGVCFVLGPGAGAGPTEATLVAADCARVERPDPEEDASAWRSAAVQGLAEALIHSIRGCFAAAGLSEPFRGDVYVDVNGEPWKSMVWGFAQTRLGGLLDLDRVRVIAPAESFGDVGAASAAASVSVAVRSFVRGYAAGPHALVLTVSDSGETSAILLGGGSA